MNSRKTERQKLSGVGKDLYGANRFAVEANLRSALRRIAAGLAALLVLAGGALPGFAVPGAFAETANAPLPETDGAAADGTGAPDSSAETGGFGLAAVPEYDEEYYGRFRDAGLSVSVYNWGEYLSDGSDGLMDICAEFEALTGITVYYTNFATNEELYAKMKGGGTSYDVVFPSDYMIARMIAEDMLTPLHKENIPNLKYIDPQFMNPQYDPGSMYSVPYTWNTVAIIYNTELVDEVPESWDVLWDEKYRNEMLMFSNSRDAFAIACKALGYSMNTENEAELREAADLLIEQKPLVQAYVMDQIFDKMENNEAAIAPYYAGDATLMMPYNENIAVAFPKEGTNLFIDAACIPKNAAHKEAAEMFINFLNEPEVAKENAEFIGYATPNLAAYALLDPEIQQDEAIYPPAEVIANSEQFIHLSEETNLLMDQLWTEVMAKGDSFVSWGLPPILAIAAIVIGKEAYRAKKRAAYRRMSEDLPETEEGKPRA